MTDYVSSFLENIKQKTTNPFLGTIIFVAIVRYWDVIYAFFMFDDDCDMLFKQTYIHNYFAGKSFWWEIFVIIFQSFGILLSTYVLLTISRLFLKFYEKHMISRMDKWTDKNSVKTLIEYQALENRLSETFEKLRKVNNENNELEIRLGGYKEEVAARETKITESNILVGAHEQHIKDLNVKNELLEADNQNLNSEKTTNEAKIIELERDYLNIRLAHESELFEVGRLNLELEEFLSKNKILEKTIRDQNDVIDSYSQIRKIDDVLEEDYELPEWLILHRDTILSKIENLKNSDFYKTLDKVKKSELLRVVNVDFAFKFIIFIRNRRNEKNKRHYIELSKIESYLKIEFLRTTYRLEKDESEIRMESLNITDIGMDFLNYLLEDLSSLEKL